MNRTAILRVAFWASALFALVMASLPQPVQVPGAPSDKVQHIAAFAALAALASAAYRTASPVTLGVGLSLFGASIELVQAIPILRRDCDPLDWLADTVAAAAVLILVQFLRNRSSRESGRGG